MICIFMVVDLPERFGPSWAKKLTSSTAGMSEKYSDTLRNSSTVPPYHPHRQMRKR